MKSTVVAGEQSSLLFFLTASDETICIKYAYSSENPENLVHEKLISFDTTLPTYYMANANCNNKERTDKNNTYKESLVKDECIGIFVTIVISPSTLQLL